MEKDLRSSLVEDQYAVIPGLLTRTDCLAILNGLDYTTFQPAKKIIGHVHQGFSRLRFEPKHDDYSCAALFVERLQVYLQFALKETIIFNDMWFQRYTPGRGAGISPHYDTGVYKYCVAILLLQGESNFYLYENEQGSNPVLVQARMGDCILLAAPGITETEHGLYHGVANVETERLTLTLRHQTPTNK